MVLAEIPFVYCNGEWKKGDVPIHILIYHFQSDTMSKDVSGDDHQQSDKDIEGSDVSQTYILYAM
jgi:hypothetical protein